MGTQMTQLVDGFGRVHRDLRISITDRCNFRCTYCMPPEGLAWLPREELLSYEELTRIATICVERFGFDGIRLTGGEPTVRADLPGLIERLAKLNVDLALTTNGSRLSQLANQLVDAGLRRINISLDTLRADRFEQITLRNELDSVLTGIDAALAAGLQPVKVNCVVMRGINDDEIVEFATFGREKGVQVRFIEFMPLDAQGDWRHESVISKAEILSRINEVYPLEEGTRTDNDPATRHNYVDGKGSVGVIPSVTEAFCSSCDRVRLTADGMLRHCLFATRELDLRSLLRGGASDEQIAAAISGEVAAKWAGHQINQVHFIRPSRSMSQIGG